jgi:hypothetical protein
MNTNNGKQTFDAIRFAREREMKKRRRGCEYVRFDQLDTVISASEIHTHILWRPLSLDYDVQWVRI